MDGKQGGGGVSGPTDLTAFGWSFQDCPSSTLAYTSCLKLEKTRRIMKYRVNAFQFFFKHMFSSSQKKEKKTQPFSLFLSYSEV